VGKISLVSIKGILKNYPKDKSYTSHCGIVFIAYLINDFMKKANNTSKQGQHEHPLPQEISARQKQINERAHDEALNDMDNDPDLTASSPNDDLDEGESARLGEENTDLV
jgi:hypothetical protein